LGELGLLDITPIKLSPTWRNKRIGEDYIAKRLDHFLISENLVESPLLFRQWVGSGGESDHHPIFLEVAGRSKKPAIPFKFNSSWLKEEEFLALVKEIWTPITPGRLAVVQFARNLKNLKKDTVEWARKKKQQDEHELINIEASLQSIYDSEGGGFASPEVKEALLVLEKKRRKLLEAKEAEWRLKNRALWLQSGDENTKFFRLMLKGEKWKTPFGALRTPLVSILLF
jgi:hypothetical protein